MLLTLVLITIVIFNNINSNESNIISNTNKDKQVINNNMITMMYETEAGSGEYVETKDTTWPESGYIFNDTLSGCENGGELEYNSQNNTINLLSNSSDRCYVYFDKYDGVWIDNVVATNVTGSSVTLDVSATSENGNITAYYYSVNDNEYVSSTTTPITINNLNKLTEYNIKVYAIDNTGAKSNIYEIVVSTTDISVPVINSVSVSNITDSGFTLTVDATSDVGIKKYYFTIDGSGEYNAGTSTTGTFTFDTLNDDTNYNVLVFVEDINDNYSEKYGLYVQTEEKRPLLADYIIGLYNGIQGNNGIYYHTNSLANSANDNSYRYSGANPNNYVCFGSDAISCPNDNLYRIIGVFENQVKLIKSTSYGSYEWNSERDSTWNPYTKTYPDIRTTLNSTYYNTLGTTWQNKIATHAYKVGGMAYSSKNTAKQYYNTEVGSRSSSTTDSMKIGLMYVSDYGFAASPDYWTTGLYSYQPSKSSNWMNINIHEWTISRDSDDSYYAFSVRSAGDVANSPVYNSYGVRPVFYLTSSTEYLSGSGTSSDPIRIQ